MPGLYPSHWPSSEERANGTSAACRAQHDVSHVHDTCGGWGSQPFSVNRDPLLNHGTRQHQEMQGLPNAICCSGAGSNIPGCILSAYLRSCETTAMMLRHLGHRMSVPEGTMIRPLLSPYMTSGYHFFCFLEASLQMYPMKRV